MDKRMSSIVHRKYTDNAINTHSECTNIFIYRKSISASRKNNRRNEQKDVHRKNTDNAINVHCKCTNIFIYGKSRSESGKNNRRNEKKDVHIGKMHRQQ